jgi:hypothetical protein
MNAHRELIKPQNGMLLIPVPEDMKEADFFEVFIVEAVEKAKIKKKVERLDFKSLAGRFSHISDEKLKELDNFRNEWERDI